MIFAENYAKIIQSPEVGGRIQVSGDSDLSPGLLSFSGNQIKNYQGRLLLSNLAC
jgi:hypothetical protein